MEAVLVLEDGSCFEGVSLGIPGERAGEVILNTSIVGYQEIMTDPANVGKILILTYPLIGNYGVTKKFYESRKCWIESLVIKEESRICSNWQAEDTFANFLRKENVLAIGEVDTRTVAAKIRDNGEMWGMVSTKKAKVTELVKRLKDYKKKAKRDFIKDISVKEIEEKASDKRGPRIAVLDLGMLNNFSHQLQVLGCSLVLLPYNTPAEEILGIKPDGLVIPNGPEEDIALTEIVKVVKKLLGRIPILGISLGQEIIALALGGRRRKLKLGHHGANYPVKSPSSYKGEITFQNHSFVVDDESINGDNVSITLYNLNDNTIEGMESKSLKFISVQYYPLSPGFDEVNDVFIKFLSIAGKGS